jgi:hypothetical protein
MINAHQTSCASKALTGVLEVSFQVLNSCENIGKKSEFAAATITLEPLHTLTAAAPIIESTTKKVNILVIVSLPPNNIRKNAAAIVSSIEELFTISSAGTTERNATFTRRSV